MKITKFGNVSVNEDGQLQITGFCFARENDIDRDIDVNSSKDHEYLIRIVANTLLDAISPEPVKADFTIERIVADAIRKAKGV